MLKIFRAFKVSSCFSFIWSVKQWCQEKLLSESKKFQFDCSSMRIFSVSCWLRSKSYQKGIWSILLLLLLCSMWKGEWNMYPSICIPWLFVRRVIESRDLSLLFPSFWWNLKKFEKRSIQPYSTSNTHTRTQRALKNFYEINTSEKINRERRTYECNIKPKIRSTKKVIREIVLGESTSVSQFAQLCSVCVQSLYAGYTCLFILVWSYKKHK